MQERRVAEQAPDRCDYIQSVHLPNSQGTSGKSNKKA
jgi:hypothetical protein